MPYSMWIGIDMGLVLIAALLVVYGEVINVFSPGQPIRVEIYYV